MASTDSSKPTGKKSYHTIATGQALQTVKRHEAPSDLQLFGSCFCPFVQRVWIALEAKGIPYQYTEVDPYQKTEAWLSLNPRGLVPALRHGDWRCYESTVLFEYLEDLGSGRALLPAHPQQRAHSRLWADHVNRKIVPGFYRLLQEQDHDKRLEHTAALHAAFVTLMDAASPMGPFFLGNELGFVDIQIAPWVVRLRRVLKPYRGWLDPEPGSRMASWVDAIESNEAVKATTSGDELYLDSYERYAENRPNTSELAKAINEGKSLP